MGSIGLRVLPFQFPLQLVEEPPVRALRDDLLRARADHAGLVQPERVEPERVLGIELSPLRPRDLLQGLDDVILASGEAALEERARGPSRIDRAHVIALE